MRLKQQESQMEKRKQLLVRSQNITRGELANMAI